MYETIPVLTITDDGRDPDDIEALAYFAGANSLQSMNSVEFAGIVATHMIPDRRANIARAVMNHLGYPKVPIGVGSIFPLGKEDELLVKYLREHTIEGRSYEGDGIIECYPDAVDLIGTTIDTHGPNLSIAGLAPLTDLAKAIEHDPQAYKQVKGIHIQGQALINESTGKLEPDPEAYNLKEDMQAAELVFSFQDYVPMTFVGKHTAYQTPLTKVNFNGFESTGNPVGKYLRVHAEKGIECFARRSPEIFERVFGIPADELHTLDELSKPYDALVAKSIVNPDGLVPVHVGHHTLYGMTPKDHGVKDPAKLKFDIASTILFGLYAGNDINGRDDA